MSRRNVVLLAALAVLLLVPLSASAGSATGPGVAPVISAPGTATPGSVVKYGYGVSGYKVAVFRVSLTLPKQMKFVSSTKKPSSFVNGKPTWTFRNLMALTDGRGFFFYVKISKTARPGKLYFVMKEHASNGELGYDYVYLHKFPTRIVRPK